MNSTEPASRHKDDTQSVTDKILMSAAGRVKAIKAEIVALAEKPYLSTEDAHRLRELRHQRIIAERALKALKRDAQPRLL